MNKHFTRPAIAGLLFGCIAGLAQAQVQINQSPLVVAQPLPPNIMFIMDDSGSMGWQHMPGTAENWTRSPPSGLPHSSMDNDIRLRASNINTQWYDPKKDYLPWKNADGSQWNDIDPASAPYDASGVLSSSTWNLRRSSYPTSPSDTNKNSTSRTSSSGRAFRFQGFYVYQGGGEASDDNYKRFDFRRNDSPNRWEARLCDSNVWGTGTNLSGCVYYLGNNAMGPFGRTLTDEIQNYANWFSYYRLRTNMAKAAASRVFAELSESYRVGYDTVHNRQHLRIPVNDDDGLFRSTNKSAWFSRLFDTNANSGTPLREVLSRAGGYFMETGDNGPWGPAPQLSCRQNFTLLTTDGYWNGADAGGDTDTGPRADNDSTDGEEMTGPAGREYQYIAGPPYEDDRNDTLADAAMYYWKTDLREDLKNDVPTSVANPAFWQHMVTFGISIGLQGSLDPTAAPPASWPNPKDTEDNHRIDDLWHAALNSRGEFIVASDADAFIDSLNAALGTIADRLGSGASLAANSTSLDEGSVTYQARYWSGMWRGDLVAFPVSNGRLADEPAWSASSALPAWSDRKIYFNNGNQDPDDAHQPFNWTNVSAANMGGALGSEAVVDYLRGHKDNEQAQGGGGTLRARTSALGDIVNSQPVYVGAPIAHLHANAEFTGASEYASFAASKSNRTPVIYVGGNDGMLHGFNAVTGAETYAFIPKAAIDNDLADLADPAYGKDEMTGGIPHRYFVDGELTVADVYSSTDGWRTVLIGTMGRGGRAVFALDVTDPAEVKFLWEKSGTDVPELGQVLGRPLVVKLGNNDWRALIGNGMNSNGATAQLLMFDVFSGESTAISTGATGNNGLSAVLPWDSNGDGFTDIAYAGDRLGNLWRFSDLGGTPSADKLFEAGAAQPITAAPMVGINLKTKQRWVFFGTGQYLNTADLTNTAVQSWYGVIDSGSLVSRGNLVERSIFAQGEVNGFPARSISPASANDMSGKSGWYIDLQYQSTAEGERMVTQNQYRHGALIGTTRIPDSSDPCNPTGRGFVMAIDPFTGARLPQTYFDLTLDGSFDSADMLVIDGQRIPVSGVGFGAGPNNPTFVDNSMHVSLDDGSTRSFGVLPPLSGSPVARRSWRELLGE